MRALALAALLGLSSPVMSVAQPLPAPSAVTSKIDAADPFIWLEDVYGAKPMAWVEAENARTVSVLESDPRYATLYAQALTIAEARDRIPSPSLVGGGVLNFWQDPDHVRGIWRRTTPAGYAQAQPPWETLIDLDQLSTAEKANWVWKGVDCEQPGERLCLVSLSNGGEDAVVLREYDLAARRFVQNGFSIPKGKHRVAWEDENTLLLAQDAGQGSLTASGYPFIVKRVTRGRPLSEAVEVYRGTAADGGYGVSPTVFVDGQGRRASVITRPLSTFEFETYLLTPRGPRKLGLPLKASVEDLVAGRLLIKLEADWRPEGSTATLAQGSVVSVELAAAMADPARLKPTVVFAPGPRQSVETVAATKDRVLLDVYDNVRGRVLAFTPTPTGWARARIPLPDNASVGVVTTSSRDDQAYLGVTSFLTPSTLWRADAATAQAEQLKTLPAKFDASTHVVEQFEATSKDGTKVPYFVVRPKGLKYDGSNPTLLYAYGGFQVSQTPNYSAGTGKLWLERGGTYVLANIRGGGEFGPAWHDAGLKTKRQVVYDDFAAVGQDLIARKITSPRRLGIRGGSNGGLLMGVEFNQHPDLWNAVIIDVPLLDMLRIGQIAAGASWAGEYGEVSDPEVRAFWEARSPYHNLKRGVLYPEPFIFTTTKDDRVGPVHARKFAARMKEYGLPYLFYENTEGGHAAGANLRQQARTQALEMTYLTRKLMD